MIRIVRAGETMKEIHFTGEPPTISGVRQLVKLADAERRLDEYCWRAVIPYSASRSVRSLALRCGMKMWYRTDAAEVWGCRS